MEIEHLEPLFLSLSALRRVLAGQADASDSSFVQLGLTLVSGTIRPVDIHDRELRAFRDITYGVERFFLEHDVVCEIDVRKARIVNARAKQEDASATAATECIRCIDGEHFTMQYRKVQPGLSHLKLNSSFESVARVGVEPEVRFLLRR